MKDYIFYEIQPNDTLESIAQMQHTTVEELVRFHNRHCGVTQLIFDAKLPAFISNIFVVNPKVDARLIDTLPKVPAYVSNFVYASRQSHLYRINIKTAVIFLGKKISEHETELEWQIDFNMPQHGYLNKKEVFRKSVRAFPKIGLADTVLYAMNQATGNLFLRLNKEGEIDAIVNNYELQKRWEAIKIKQLKTLELNIPELTAMFNLCDEEFNALYESLNNNLLFNLFFLPFGKIKTNREHSYLSENKVLSQFFQPLFIPHSRYFEANEDNNGNVQVHLTSKIDRKMLTPQLQKLFKEKYAAISQMDLNFDYHTEGYYTIHNNGLLQDGKIFVKEQVNLNCFYTAEYEFKLLDI